MGAPRKRAVTRCETRGTPTRIPKLAQPLSTVAVALLALLPNPSAASNTPPDNSSGSANLDPTLAEPPTALSFVLRYTAPESCPTEESVRSKLERAEVRFSADAEVTIDLTEAGDSFEMRVHLRAEGREGQRLLQHGDCNALLEAAAALLSLAASDEEGLDALWVAPAEEEPPKEAPAPAPPVQAPPPKPPKGPQHTEKRADSAPPTPSPPLSLEPFVGVGALLASSTLPSLALGFGAYGGVTLAPFRLGVGASWWPGVNTRPGDGPGVEASQFAARIEPCGLLGSAEIQVGACATASGHWLRATALDITDPDSGNVSWWSVGPTVLIRHEIGAGFAAELAGGIAFPLRQPELRYFSQDRGGDEVLFQPGFLAIDSRITLLRHF